MSINRVTGSSGFDVTGTVKSLMKAQSIPLDKMKQDKQILQWQTDDYRTLNSKFLDLRNSAFSMKLQSPYLAKIAASADETTISAKGSSNAVNGNYTVKVTQLASGGSVTSNIVGATTSGAATTLSTLALTMHRARL
jgi:flagellar hook-associated protein 2